MIMESWNHGIMEPWSEKSWNHGIMEPWIYGILDFWFEKSWTYNIVISKHLVYQNSQIP